MSRADFTAEERRRADEIRDARRLEDGAWRELRRAAKSPHAAAARERFETLRDRRRALDGSGPRAELHLSMVRRAAAPPAEAIFFAGCA